MADTDSKTNEGWEDYTEDLYVFTIQNQKMSTMLILINLMLHELKNGIATLIP